LHLVTHMIDDGTSTLLHTCVATKILWIARKLVCI
jgi:hypothetical protein